MKYCPRCGSRCGDADLHCGNCGFYFDSQNPAGSSFSSGGYPSPAPQTNGMAVASMVLGIVGLVTLCGCIGFVLAVVALVLGIVSYGSIRNSHGRQSGSGMAIAGMVMGAVPIVLLVVVLILSAVDAAFAGALQRGFSDYYPYAGGPQIRA